MSSRRRLKLASDLLQLLSFVIAMLGVLLAGADVGDLIPAVLIASGVAAMFASLWTLRRSHAHVQPTLQDRVEMAFASLRSAASLTADIEAEIAETHMRMQLIQRELERDSQLAELKAEEAAAVRELVRTEFRRERRPTLLQNAAFTALGLAGGVLLQRMFG